MLILFTTRDPATPEKPAVERLINPRQIIDVEPVKADKTGDGQPVGSIIRTSDKRQFRVDLTPREVQRAITTGGGR